jgi:AraC-like DNA-binding protein
VKIGQRIFLLQKGDMFLVHRGKAHELFSSQGEKILEIEEFNERVDKFNEQPNRKKYSNRPRTTFVSVRYEVPQEPMHPFLLELPDHIFIKADEVPVHHSLHTLIALISQEVDKSIGSDLILQRLADILLYHVLRYHLEKYPAKGAGWRNALADEKMRSVIESIHRKPEYPWTLESLAEEIGISRASLASRFREALGTTPMQYLASLRIEKGREMLRQQSTTLEEVARKVGYSSAFAYSKAYKRMRGHSPSEDNP